MTVEVFKTNVSTRRYANVLLNQIHKTFTKYHANFDLDDCDKILRIQCSTGAIRSRALIMFLKDFGCNAEILPD
ncbi:hypothetical protein SNE25_17015 [Mucilaginibacter sabulilitoris]|uniref:Uncharacterized protein n=1 Tax=Mucilaginibacter sabulilitoris TaxID=1173583 RepID=A0ABZ0TCS5_9SPHI|nr:hypothetical protein [Mucilaginibacter sabulilitoris]WPU91022.1 hypothetical protein SNE25_17015 [Mucilaginibacter sabulilitoris]